MKINIDSEHGTIFFIDATGREVAVPVYSQEGFKLLSSIWLKQEWDQLHWQSFSWMGFPILQLPEDLLRLQEVIVSLKPDVIVETGTHRGGTAIFFASMCRLLGNGRVISIDTQTPPDTKRAVAQSPFAGLITLIDGDSVSDEVVKKVRHSVRQNEKVFIFLDSGHSKDHVLRELKAHAPLVTPGSYIVAADGVMRYLADTPRGRKEWAEDNPAAAAHEFLKDHPEFRIERPKALFNDQYVIDELTFWPDAWLKRTEARCP
jgi:cephalosporin hydroxylase